jgi:ubiquinone/menaquinone biosynthesis C-methylase UbiE
MALGSTNGRAGASHAEGMSEKNVYTHGHHESVLRSHTWRTAENSAAYLLSHVVAGMDMLDVGCGPGTITIDLAKRVAPGQVVGLDASESVLEGAARTAVEASCTNVTFQTGDIARLPFEDGSFDIVHAHQVLQHLTDPVAALCEMRRVCRPGGIVAARDADYAAMTWFPEDPVLTRALDLYRQTARINGAEPDAGRHLLSWATRAGFDDITPTASTWCYATPADRTWWGSLWADRVTESSLATQLVDYGLATPADLASFAQAWRRWMEEPEGWYAVLHGEIICRA